ncbi:hypothetical protein PAEPH01_0772 [Pancytospora epiphaga]|nr:hypothetical protein PAEPH01_0772 [Pancytospora epiphaga]
MDRMEEFLSFIDSTKQNEFKGGKKCFYESFNESITGLLAQLSRMNSLRPILSLENEFLGLQKQISTVFEVSKLEGTRDIKAHYEGIKQILNLRLSHLRKMVEVTKRRVCEIDVDLSPERPRQFREVAPNVVLEQENRRIVGDQEYEQVRHRLQKIDVIQKAINENLIVQDERIDRICDVTKNTGEVYGDINENIDFDNGSLMRRVVFVILLCLSFVLLFLHFFYK